MHDAASDIPELLMRAELLRGFDPLSVSSPQRDDMGRYWLFVTAAVGGELVSIPHITPTDKRDRPALMALYRRTVAGELARRGFTVALRTDIAGEPIGRVL